MSALREIALALEAKYEFYYMGMLYIPHARTRLIIEQGITSIPASKCAIRAPFLQAICWVSLIDWNLIIR